MLIMVLKPATMTIMPMIPAITFSIARFCFLRLALAADLDLVLLCCVAMAEDFTFTPALVLLLSVFPLFLLIPDVEPVPFKVPGVLF